MTMFRRMMRRFTRRFESYIGPLDIVSRVTENDIDGFRHIHAFQILEDVWILDRDGSDHWVCGKIMGVGIGLSGRPFHLVGYWDDHHRAYDVEPYRGPIRKIKFSEKKKGVHLHAVK